jgi:hypothetical protein
MLLVRVTGSGFVKNAAITDGHPVEFRHWKDVVEDCAFALESAAHSEEEEAIVELWLDDPNSFMTEEDGAVQTPSVRRMTAGMGLTRHSDIHQKQASANWDQDFSEAQAHAASVLSKIGNGRS